jgi:hypothetical protein
LGFSPILCSTAERGGEGEKKREEWSAPPPRRAGKIEDRLWTGSGTARMGAAVLWERELCVTKGPEPRERRCRERLHRRREPGFAKPVGIGPVRPVPGGTGPTRYTNRSGSHPKSVPTNSRAR